MLKVTKSRLTKWDLSSNSDESVTVFASLMKKKKRKAPRVVSPALLLRLNVYATTREVSKGD